MSLNDNQRFSLRLTCIIILAQFLIVTAGVAAMNSFRRQAMEHAAADRADLAVKMDRAWDQRVMLTARVEKACRR